LEFGDARAFVAFKMRPQFAVSVGKKIRHQLKVVLNQQQPPLLCIENLNFLYSKEGAKGQIFSPSDGAECYF